MAEEATRMCGDDATLRDVAALQTFTPTAAVDYISPMATLTSCQLMDPMCASLLGDATEHLYQLNHVHVTLPTKEASIKTKDDRLFARLDVIMGRHKEDHCGLPKQGHVATRFTSK